VLRNNSKSWGWLSRGLHWAVVLLIVVQIPVGFWLVDAYDVYKEAYDDDTMVMRLSMVHNTIGFLVLIIFSIRLPWRLANPTPELPPALVSYRRFLARLTHIFLYVLMIIYPLSGWSALSAYEFEFPIFFFGWDNVPGIVPSVAEGEMFDYPFFAKIHRSLWRIGGVILGLHVTAALWHQFVAKDGVLRRMLKGSASG
jgi:cytochrome b561